MTKRVLSAIAMTLAVWSALSPGIVRAGLVGASFFQISPGSGRFPDVAYDSVDHKYLVVYTNYAASPTARIAGRFVSDTGVVLGSEMLITEPTGGLYGAVTYNATDNEFLVTWDDQRAGFKIYAQRISGATGLPIGVNFPVTTVGGNRSSVAWSATSNNYLVTCSNFSEVLYQRFTNLGVLIEANTVNVSNDADFSGYPATAWASNGNQYLVAWDDEGNIYARRVDAATGAVLGGLITMTGIGTKDRPQATYDNINSRWLVQYNQTGIPGNSYDQFATLINTSGTQVGGALCMACSGAFEGDTLLGADVAFLPGLGRYFSVYGTDTGAGGQEIDANGNPVASSVQQGAGFFSGTAVAADPNLHRWLTAFDGSPSTNGSYLIWGRLYEAADLNPSGQVTNFATTPGSKFLTLTWHNPSDADFGGTLIRHKLGSYPANRNDGDLVVNHANTPGSDDSFVHRGLTAGVVHYYAAFAYDTNNNYAAGTLTTGVPAVAGDFDVDGDVDQLNFGHLQNCFSGDSVPPPPGCADADLDNDGDVDGNDFTEFLNCLGGADLPTGC